MITPQNRTKTTDALNKNHRCRFEFHDREALAVFIAGSFNDWDANAAPMSHVGNGRWVKEISLPPGRFEYRFVVNGFGSETGPADRPGRYGYRSVVNGQWVNDPSAKEVAPNPYGGFNAVLVVAQGTAA